VADLLDAARKLHGGVVYRNFSTTSLESHDLVGALDFLADGSLDGQRALVLRGFDLFSQEGSGRSSSASVAGVLSTRSLSSL